MSIEKFGGFLKNMRDMEKSPKINCSIQRDSLKVPFLFYGTLS